MQKTIELSGNEMKFKSSAATNILYKKAFGEDILVKLAAYSKNLKELKNMQAKIAELRADQSRPQEEVLEDLNKIMNSDVFTSSQKFSSETLPRLAFIMWLEANETQQNILRKLNEDEYIVWLMGIDQDDLLAITGEVMALWQAGAKTNSKPKN